MEKVQEVLWVVANKAASTAVQGAVVNEAARWEWVAEVVEAAGSPMEQG